MQDFSEEGMNQNRLILKVGDQITIKGIYDMERYWVELQDGRSGMLYFWIGD